MPPFPLRENGILRSHRDVSHAHAITFLVISLCDGLTTLRALRAMTIASSRSLASLIDAMPMKPRAHHSRSSPLIRHRCD